MNKEKIKGWVKEHKTEIALTVGWIAGGMVCGTIMYKAGLHDAIPFKGKNCRENVMHVLNKGDGTFGVAGLISENGLKNNELGELGKALVEVCGAPADSIWDRFVLISK